MNSSKHIILLHILEDFATDFEHLGTVLLLTWGQILQKTKKKFKKRLDITKIMCYNGKNWKKRRCVKVPRQRRTISKTSIYHIIMRGIDKQDIFYNDKDKEFILNQLSKVKKKFNLEIYAYCLMYNHIHLVFRVEKNLLSKSIQSLGIRYSQYFNKKYDRSGTFFESRFRSKTVEDKKYFLDVCRYVHRNPEKAGISTVEDWRWSSYNEYVTKEKIINKRVLLYYFDDDRRVKRNTRN